MDQLIDKFFPNRDDANLRIVLFSALVAYGLETFGLNGLWGVGALGLMVTLLALIVVVYAALRFLLPGLFGAPEEEDKVANWSAFALLILIGVESFGWLYAVAFVAGAAMLWWRAPEVLQKMPLIGGAE